MRDHLLRLSIVTLFLALAGTACTQDEAAEQFAFNGVIEEVREGAAPEGVAEDDEDGNSPATAALVVRIDGTAENAGFGECASAAQPTQTAFVTRGTTFIPKAIVEDPDFPSSLDGRRVGVDGLLHMDGDSCTAVADRILVQRQGDEPGVEFGTTPAPSPAPATSPTSAPSPGEATTSPPVETPSQP